MRKSIKQIKHGVFYLPIIFRKVNERSLQLQESTTLISCKKDVFVFIDKLDIFQNEMRQFPNLNKSREL